MASADSSRQVLLRSMVPLRPWGLPG